MAAIAMSDLAEAPGTRTPPASVRPSGTISMDDLSETPPPKPPGQLAFAGGAAVAMGGAVGGAVAQAGKDWWSTFGQVVDQAKMNIKSDVMTISRAGENKFDQRGNPISPSALEGALAVPKTLWDVFQLIASPVSASFEEAVGKPVEGALSDVGKAYKKAATDLGKPLSPKETEDVSRNVEIASDFINTGLQFLLIPAGGKRPAHLDPLVPGEPKTSPPPPRPPMEEGLEDTRPMIEQIKSVKDEIRELTEKNAHDAKIAELEGKLARHKIDLGFEELATKHPDAAELVADKVSEIAPEVGKKMKLKVKLKRKATPEEQVIVGKDVAEATMPVEKSIGQSAFAMRGENQGTPPRWTEDHGTMPGEPSHFLDGDYETAKGAVTEHEDGQWEATRLEGIVRDISKPRKRGETPPEPEAVSLGMFKTKEEAKSALEKAFPERAKPKGTVVRSPSDVMATGLWDNFNKKADQHLGPLIRQAKDLAKKVGNLHPLNKALQKTTGKEILGHMLDALPSDVLSSRTAYQKQLLRALSKAVGDVTIQFIPELRFQNDKGVMEPAHGYYTTDTHKIYLDADLGDKTVRVMIHELVHAATIKFMQTNPDHPLSIEMKRLFDIAKERQHQSTMSWLHDIEDRGPSPEFPYGTTTVYEFVAEAFSNRDFQRWLADSERWAKPGDKLGNLWNKFASLVQNMLGIKDKYVPLLHRTMSVAEKIIEAQGKNPPRMHNSLLSSTIKTVTAGMREASGEIYASLAREDKVDSSDLGAFKRIGAKLPAGVNVAIGKLAGYNRQIRGVFMPRTLGPGAEAAATLIQEATARRAQHMLMVGKDGFKRRNLWNKMAPEGIIKWMQGMELGAKFKDAETQTVTEAYRRWAEEIYKQDMKTGFDYEPTAHYLPRLFSEGPKVPIGEFLQKRFGSKWKNPSFIKERSFLMIQDALDAGYKLRYTNPEDMMQARQFASDTAEMQVNILKGLEEYGHAVKASPDDLPPSGYTVQRRSPTGQLYWVNRDSAKVLKNAFDTYSLWSDKGIVGDAVRGFMYLKNLIVPIRLFGLFHVTHVGFAIDTAAAFNRVSRELLSGKAANAPKAVWEGLKSGMPVVSSFVTNPRRGWRIMKAYKGEIHPSKLTTAETEFLEFANEGGFVPFLDRQWKTNAEQKFMDAVKQHSATAILHAPGALISAINKPVFEAWIPALKTASFMNETETLFRLQPELLNNAFERRKALGQVTQMIDRRFGEMSLNNQFWPKWVKDLAVMNTLSIGWQLGVIGEFGGGALDVAKIPFRGSVKEQLRTGQLNKTLYAAGYTTIAMGYTGLLSYALSGKAPEGEDWIWPRTGGSNPDGSPKRLSTPFFTREFGSIYKHVRDEGVVKATKDIVESKSSGMIALATEAAFGVNSLGQEIRNPNAPMFTKIAQTLNYILRDIEPISAQQSAGASQQTALSVTGFTPAPKYVTDTPSVAAIKSTYMKYYGGKTTPFEKAQVSEFGHQLKEAYDKGEEDKYSALRDKMMEKFDLTEVEMTKIDKRIEKGEDPVVRMFTRLDWQQQKRILDGMSEDEREIYLPRSNKEHLRDNYEPPEEK